MSALTRSAIVSLLFATPLVAQTYEPILVPSQINGAPTTMTPLRLGDDNTARIDLGFEFTYWDQTFTSAWVSSNGFVSFQSPSNLCCNGTPLDQAQRNTIYGFWTDLISNTNPYYTRGQGSILFGWYDTREYGTQNNLTFEIGLFSDNKIQFNFGNLSSLTSHIATAGITGPGADDNIQLFYGRDTQFLRNQSGILSWIASTPIVTIDCNVTPMEPSCPPQMIIQIDYVSSSSIASIVDNAVNDASEDSSTVIAAATPEIEQQIEVAQADVVSESITEQVADAIAVETTTASIAVASVEAHPERLSPEQVAALAANSSAQDMQQMMTEVPAFSVLNGPAAQFGAGGLSNAFNASQSASSSISSGQTFEIASTGGSSSPSSVANALETLGMATAPAQQVSISQSDQQSSNSMSEGQGETMAAIASVPGFASYTQVSLQDRPDFYAIRDIYRNRRIRDANFEMYRMTQSNNAKWQEMTDVQYR